MNNLQTNNFFCAEIPAGVTIEQKVRAVVGWIEARPHRMWEPFDGLTFEALRDAWPCPKPPLSDPRIREN